MFKIARKITAAAVVLAALTAPVFSGAIAVPKGEVVLTVTGAIGAANADKATAFDMDMLKSMPQVTFKTSTNWTTGVTTFTGVSLKALLAAVDAKGRNLHSIAFNDYAVDIPVSDAVDDGPIVAYLMDGQAMSPRDKGPLWIVYPFDSKSAYKTEEIYSRSIWQLNRIDVQN